MPILHSFIAFLKYECQRNKNNKQQENIVYSIMLRNKKFVGYQMYIINKGVRIRFPTINNPKRFMYIIVNVPVFLGKKMVEETDITLFKEKYKEIVYKQFFNYDEFLKSQVLNRIDYKFDYFCKDEKEKSLLLELLSKAKSKRYSGKKRIYSNEVDNDNDAITVYYNGRHYRINIYDKYEETGGLPEYQNMVRYEIQIMSSTLNRYFKEYGLIRDIDNYWNMRNFFFIEYLLPIFYIGNFYKNNIVSRMLSKCKNKACLINKIMNVQKTDCIDDLYSYYQIKQLQKLNINPLQNNINLENPLKEIFMG